MNNWIPAAAAVGREQKINEIKLALRWNHVYIRFSDNNRDADGIHSNKF